MKKDFWWLVWTLTGFLIGLGFEHIREVWDLIPRAWVVGYLIGAGLVTVGSVAFVVWWRHRRVR
jgi:hypothetical protein